MRDLSGENRCFAREVLLTLPPAPESMISPGFPDFVSRQTCAKQGTFLAEATGDICTLDLKQSWLGVFRLQQQLTEEALKKHESHSAPVNNVDLSDTALEVDGDRKLAVACQHFAGCEIIA